jgi:hypothetical protein
VKYKVIWDKEDPHCVQIHVNERLIRGPMINIDPTDDLEAAKHAIEEQAAVPERLSGFFEALCELPGIEQDFAFQHYAFMLNKGILFDWKDIMPHVLSGLKMLVSKDNTLEVMRENTRKALSLQPRPKKKVRAKANKR